MEGGGAKVARHRNAIRSEPLRLGMNEIFDVTP